MSGYGDKVSYDDTFAHHHVYMNMLFINTVHFWGAVMFHGACGERGS